MTVGSICIPQNDMYSDGFLVSEQSPVSPPPVCHTATVMCKGSHSVTMSNEYHSVYKLH